MSFQKPMVVDRKGDELTVELHGQNMKMLYDSEKWFSFFGVCDSGSSLRFSFKPKRKLPPRRIVRIIIEEVGELFQIRLMTFKDGKEVEVDSFLSTYNPVVSV